MPRRAAGTGMADIRMSEEALAELSFDTLFEGPTYEWEVWVANREDVVQEHATPEVPLETLEGIARWMSYVAHWDTDTGTYLRRKRRFYIVEHNLCGNRFVMSSGVRGIDGVSTWRAKCWSGKCLGRKLGKRDEIDVIAEYPWPFAEEENS